MTAVHGARRVVAAAIAFALLGACAPEGLSRRYRAEEAFWDAERYRAAFGGRPGIPTARREIEARYRRILERHAATPWERAEQAPCLSSVNGLRGLAWIALGRSALAFGSADAAADAFGALLAESRAGSPLAHEARLGLAAAAESKGDFAGAFAAYESLFVEALPERRLTADALTSIFPIPLYLAERRAALGDRVGADSSLALGARVIAPFRDASQDSAVRRTAGAWLTEIHLTRADWAEAIATLEARATDAETREGSALLLLAARVAFDTGDARAARRLLDAAVARKGAGEGSLAAMRLAAELRIVEGEEIAGERALSELFESGFGTEEEAALAGVALADRAAHRGDWATAVDTYARVATRYTLTEARVGASVRRAEILDRRLPGSSSARIAAADELLALARLRPGSRRSALAEDAAAMLLEQSQSWTRLVQLLDEIARGTEAAERAAAAIVRAATIYRNALSDPSRADALLAQVQRDFPGTIGAHQARLLSGSTTGMGGQDKP